MQSEVCPSYFSEEPRFSSKVSPMSETSRQIGRGSANGHHGEILQGVFEAPGGRLRRGLVTLRSDLFRSEATFSSDETDGVRVEPAWKIKARHAAELSLVALGRADCGGSLRMWSNIPLRWGLGSSTGDVTAAIRAVSDAIGVCLSREIIARLAVRAEEASDSIMFEERAILFGHRDGVVIEDLGGSLPAMKVVGFNTDSTGAGIDTLSFPRARYEWREVEAFRPLLGLLRRAVRTQEVRLVGRVASASARINQRYLPKPHFERIEKLTEQVGAVGIQVAHSGAVMGLLFDPSDAAVNARMKSARALLAEMDFRPIWEFGTGDEEVAIRWNSIESTERSPKPSRSHVWSSPARTYMPPALHS